jgi:cytidylate kinase
MARSYGQLVPSVERRLSTWLSLSEKQPVLEASRRPTITISRRFGCEAYPLAECLKVLLDAATRETWNIYDKALLDRVSHDEHLSLTLLEGLGGPTRAMDSLGFLFADHLAHDVVFRRMAKHIVQVAQAGNAIIVGRGGAILTQRFPNCFHFRLDAGVEFRVESLVKRLELSVRDAQRLVRENERTREKFIEDCLGVSVSDLAFYDAVFNNARQDITAIAKAIVSYVSERWPDKRFFGTQLEPHLIR